MINRISRQQWQYIIDNYFYNYYDNEKTRINRRKWRAMYLTNIDYVKSNPHLNLIIRRINSYEHGTLIITIKTII